MSTYWNIECRRCGLEVFEDREWTNHQGVHFAELCASGMLDVKPMRTSSWELMVCHDIVDYLRIDPAKLDTGCDHDFEPRDEYGRWAKPELWPDWHPKSKVTVASATADCSGLGEVRCIGE